MEKENNQLALLLNCESSRDLISIDMTFKIHKQIDTYLAEDRFNYLVTVDNLKEVKANNTELNSTIKAIKDFGKKIVDDESKDINSFKECIKDFIFKIEAKRQKRKEEIEVFENETKIILKDLVENYVNEQYDVLKLRNEFKKVSFDDLIIISNITKAGSLTKGIKDTLNMRLQICKSSQDKFDMRLYQLENICYKKGLETQLTINNIQGIIYEDSDVLYETKLNLLIDDELKRVENIKLQLQKKADDEAKERVNSQIKKANEIFLQPWGMMDIETLEQKKIETEKFDISIFDLCYDHAKSLKQKAITFINQSIWGKNKALEDSKKVIDDMITPSEDEIVIVQKAEPKEMQFNFDFSENKIVDNIQDSEIIKNFAFYDGEQIEIEPFIPYEKQPLNEDEKIIVAKFRIQGTDGLTNDDVLSAIRDILFNAGICDDSLVSLEVL